MQDERSISRAGYLKENYHYFHLKDTAGQELDFHFHEFDKIVLLLSGRVDYTVEGRNYSLKPWDVLLVKHHTIHRAVIDKTVPYERIIIYLDGKYFGRSMPDAHLMESFELADKCGEHLLTPSPEQKESISAVLKAYETAESDEVFGAAALKETYIIQLLIYISRMAAAAEEPRESQYDPKIQQILSYINENLNDELSVDQLAERVYLSKYHFMRLFKAQTGSTVHAYVRQRRLLYAARLIREGSSVGKAAADSGFGDYSAFHRAFRETFGISPGSLKR
jgi:AraC-like DNA-binding protein